MITEIKLALRYAVKRKSGSNAAVAGIATAAFLLTIAVLLRSSLIAVIEDVTKQEKGNYHAIIEGLYNNDIDELTREGGLEGMLCINIEPVSNNDILILNVTEGICGFFNIDITEGRQPEKNNEILISQELAATGVGIGDILRLGDGTECNVTGIGEKNSMQKVLYQIGEQIPENGQVIIRRGNYTENTPYYCFVRVKKIRYIERLLDKYGSAAVLNNEYLDILGYEKNKESVFSSINKITRFLTAVILVSAIMYISNAFMITYNENIKETELLCKLGACKKQISRIFVFQTVIYTAIGLIIGEGLGIIALSFLTAKISNRLLELVYITGTMTLKIDIVYLFYIAVLILLVSVIAAQIPIAKGNELQKEKKKRRLHRTAKHSSKKNNVIHKIVQRYKTLYFEKNVFSMISISVSLIVFLSVGLICQSERETLCNTWNNREYDIKVTCSIKSEEGFRNWYNRSVEGNIRIQKAYWTKPEENINLNTEMLRIRETEEDNGIETFETIFVSDSLYEELCNTCIDYKGNMPDCILTGLNVTYLQKDGIEGVIKEEYFEREEQCQTEAAGYQLRAGTAFWENIKKGMPFLSDSYKRLIIFPYTARDNYTDILSKTSRWEVYIFTKQFNIVEEELKTNTDGERISLLNLAADYQYRISVVELIDLFSKAFTGMIGIIAVSNIFLTVGNSILVRKGDFICFKTLGMDDKTLLAMMLTEGALKLTDIILVTAAVFSIAYYFITRIVIEKKGVFPTGEVIICLIVVTAVYLLASVYAFMRIRNLSDYVETVRD